MTISVTGCSTCSRVFISMKKNSSGRSADDDELDGARAGVVDAARGLARRPRRSRARVAASSSGDGASSIDLLVPALQAALALAEVDDVAVRVGEHLDLDVPGARDEPLEEQRVVAERARRLAAARGQRVRQLGRFVRRAACPCRRRRPTA